MQLQIKEAWITLISSVLYLVLIHVVAPMMQSYRAELVLAFLVLHIFTLWLGRMAIKVSFKALNEREKAIRFQAAMIATHMMGAVVMLTAICYYLLYGRAGMVPLFWVLMLAFYTWMSLYIGWSASMLILHKVGLLKL